MAQTRPESFDYAELSRSLAQTYWYEGDFKTYVIELEKRVALHRPGRDRAETMFDGIELNQLAMGYDALGDYAKAEQCYRRALQSGEASRNLPFNQSALGIVTARMHANDLEGAKAAVAELASELGPDFPDIYGGVLAALSGQPVADAALLRTRGFLGKPGSLGFLEGVLAWAAGDEAGARAALSAFCLNCASNPQEWGITQRWEVAKAKEILVRLGGDPDQNR